jgi:hypothetical protein
MKSRVILAVSSLSAGLLLAGGAFAKVDERVTVTRGNGGAEVSIPAHAAELMPDVYSLGTATVDGQKVEGIMVVHRSNAKTSGASLAGSICYSYLAADAKWKSQEAWVINPANNSNLTGSTLFTIIDSAITEWETAAHSQIMGNGSITSSTLSADQTSPDGVNEIYFGAISDPGVIAVTITWGNFGGVKSKRQIIEMDQIYDQVDFTWSTKGLASAMDFENIAQHELGHGIGMGHSPTMTTCKNETMYPYASNGETLKRDISVGDAVGIDKLY